MTQHREPGLEWAVDRHDRSTVVHLVGEIDIGTVQTLEEAVRAGMGSVAPVVILDLADVTFLGSIGLRVLVMAHNEATTAGRTLRVVDGSPIVHRVLQISGLSQLLALYPTVDDAEGV
nr:STAS domain-containing protein [Kibdelosporangium sp. MJ126-NF4]CEL20887.1 Anti-sigma F factor antagonist (spoIIAA-2); Anti-sigma B factor antagonist RsbV [Kibdelosporangium sp. MJ126-NF4]CTQ98308.1 Anti-sigma F factor antagonist (spoIIAA-2); Anti-sigma B factor antagonist RsbV [Kibdelosporangium sp. MJ126-NF4]